VDFVELVVLGNCGLGQDKGEEDKECARHHCGGAKLWHAGTPTWMGPTFRIGGEGKGCHVSTLALQPMLARLMVGCFE